MKADVRILFGALVAGTLLFGGCKPNDQPQEQTSVPTSRPALAAASAPSPLAPPTKVGAAAVIYANVPKHTLSSGLVVQDVLPGEGEPAKKGDTVYVAYTGWLASGKVFDASKPGKPLSFVLGDHSVIDGWDQGVTGMKLGAKRVLTIPPSLAYGESQKGEIPPDSTLTFEVDLVGINDRKAPPMPAGPPTQPASAPATAP